MFGSTRRANRELEQENDRLRAQLRTARADCEETTVDRDLWRRRSIEWSNRLTATAQELRTERRHAAALQRLVDTHDQQLANRAGATPTRKPLAIAS